MLIYALIATFAGLTSLIYQAPEGPDMVSLRMCVKSFWIAAFWPIFLFGVLLNETINIVVEEFIK